MISDLANIFDERMVDQRPDHFVVIVLIGAIHLRGNLQWNAASDGNLDSAVDTLFRCDSAQHGQIPRAHRPRRQQFFRQAVVDGLLPVGLRHRTPLRVRDRNHRDRRKCREHRLMLRQIEPAVQGGQKRGRLPGEQRERIVVEMKVQEVELFIVAFLQYALQHHHVQRVGIAHRSVKAQRLRPSRVQLCGGLGIAAGKQGDVVPQCHEFLGQPVYHPLGSAIKPGRNRLRQWSNLRDAHL